MFKKCKLVLICWWCWIWILHCVHFNYKKIVIKISLCHILTNIGYFTSFLFVLEYCKQYEAKSKIFVGINFYWFLKLYVSTLHIPVYSHHTRITMYHLILITPLSLIKLQLHRPTLAMQTLISKLITVHELNPCNLKLMHWSSFGL